MVARQALLTLPPDSMFAVTPSFVTDDPAPVSGCTHRKSEGVCSGRHLAKYRRSKLL